MIIRNTLKAAAMAGVCMIPLMALAAEQPAQDTGFDLPDAAPGAPPAASAGNPGVQETTDNSVSVGVRGQSETSAVFGRYNGQFNGGVTALGDAILTGRDTAPGGTYYYKFNAQDVNFGGGDFSIAPTSSVDLRVGQQGTWNFHAAYDALSYVQSNNFTTLFSTSGGLVGGFTPAPLTAATATAGPKAQSLTVFSKLPFDVDTVGVRRDRGTADINYIQNDWMVAFGMVHEHKEGTIEQSLTNGGSNGTFAYFAQPINYDTDRATVSANYTGQRLQAKLQYALSSFQDNNSAFNLAPFESVTPYTVTKTTQGGTFYAQIPSAGAGGVASSVYSQAPSNMAHSFSGQAGYTLSDVTRLNANATYGLLMQNASFAAQSGNTALLSGLGSNPNSLNGFVQTMFANLAMTTRVASLVDVRVAYTLDGRQSDTGNHTINTINPNNGDIGTSSGTYTAYRGANADPLIGKSMFSEYFNRLATPESWVNHKVVAEAGYRILPSTKLTLGYTFTEMDRTESLVKSTDENAISAKLRTTFAQGLVGSVDLNHSVRAASAPDFSIWQKWARSYYSPTGGSAGPVITGGIKGGECWTIGQQTSCMAVPSYEQSRTLDAATARLTAVLGPDVTTGIYAKYAADHYPGDLLGISRDDKISGGPDLGYRITPDADAHFFYTYQHKYQVLRDSGSSVSLFSNTATGDDTQTAGLSGSWRVSPKLKLGSEYLFSYGAESVMQSGVFASSPADGSMPLVTSMLNSFKLHGDYEWEPGIVFSMGYAFDRLISNDWQLWGTTSGEATSGTVNPAYSIHTVTGRVAFKW